MLLLAGCAGPEWRNADLQIDVEGMAISDEDRVRVCVEGAGQREQTVGSGTVSFPGLPTDQDLRIWVDLVDTEERAARAGPTRLSSDTEYAVLKWQDCSEDCPICEDPGKGAEKGEESLLLAIRFRD